MANVFLFGVFLLCHGSSAFVPAAEVNEVRFRAVEEKIDLIYGMMQDMKREITDLKKRPIYDETVNVPSLRNEHGMNEPQMNDTDLEERVTFLEFQMVNVNEEVVTITEDLIGVENRVVNTEGQITVVLADQVIQDERLLELETDAESVAVAIVGLDNSINTLETVDSALNDSIQGLDSRVSTLEELNTTIADLHARLDRLEQDGTFAFHAFLGTYTSLPDETVIAFPNINVNIGNGYDGTTGEFTVPPGGDGLYFIYAHFLFDTGDGVWIRMQVNDVDLCVAFEDGVNAPSYGGSSCGAVVILQEGDVVHMRVTATSDDTPLHSHGSPVSSFSGIRIAPL